VSDIDERSVLMQAKAREGREHHLNFTNICTTSPTQAEIVHAMSRPLIHFGLGAQTEIAS
jgi:hypothetical protein